MATLVRSHNTISTINHIPITIFFSLLLIKFVASDGMVTHCTNQTRNETQFETNQFNLLQTLFANFVSSVSSSSFQNSTVGEPPNEAYGLYLCRGDATTEQCHACVTNLTEWVTEEPGSSTCKAGFGFVDNCMMRYANYSFFGESDYESLASMDTGDIVTNVAEFNETLTGMVDELIAETAFESEGLFATREASVGREGGKVYALAQCTPDIGRTTCDACLKTASLKLRGNRTSGWFMFSSCQLRYNNSRFYGMSSLANSNVHAIKGAFILVTWIVFLLC